MASQSVTIRVDEIFVHAAGETKGVSDFMHKHVGILFVEENISCGLEKSNIEPSFGNNRSVSGGS